VDPTGRSHASVSDAVSRFTPRVDSRKDLGEPPAPGEYDLVVVEYDELSDAERERLRTTYSLDRAKTALVVLSDGKCRDDFPRLFEGRVLTNLVARNDELSREDLSITLAKLLSRDIFGIEKYFAGKRTQALQVQRSADKETALVAAEGFASALGVNARLVGQFCSVVDEFVTNAVYNAPTDADGNKRYQELGRELPVDLAPSEHVEIKFSSDGQRFAVSAADRFGSLTTGRLLDYLAKCYRKGPDQIDVKPGGAGLGFYYVFESLSHFVVNISPGRRTEMIGIIDGRGSYRDFAKRGKSFNLFVVEA
jgi:hypothetical protein